MIEFFQMGFKKLRSSPSARQSYNASTNANVRASQAVNANAIVRKPSLFRVEKQRQSVSSRFIAFDLETTRITAGTPKPLFITAYGENPALSLSIKIESIDHLAQILIERFLIDCFSGVRFIGWNANNFDSYLVAAALLTDSRFVIRPYMTRSKNLRGMRVMLKCEQMLKRNEMRWWEFTDGIAMLGMIGVSLKEFLSKFAPDHQKLTGVIDFEKEDFDASKPAHREYAFRDSEGLFYGMQTAENILLQHFNRPLAVTMGNACIKIFTAHIPELKVINDPGDDVTEILRDHVMRGGYCYCVRRFEGPIWKYDLNQAYAAAMREALMPAGFAYRSPQPNKYARVYIARVHAINPNNKIPFYVRIHLGNRIVSQFAEQEIADCWITSIEHAQLIDEGWQVEVLDSVWWDDIFQMKEYVDRLEYLRANCLGGPKGAQGTMFKMIGNHSYGKTVERVENFELILSKECPDGWAEYLPDDDDKVFSHLWFRKADAALKAYHKPQIGAFITAHVRMVVRRAALVDPEAWLYADTDCVVFTRDVARLLDIDATRYGAWKVEAEGDEYRIIAKKVYAEVGFDTDDRTANRRAKGLNVRKLSDRDFEEWINGTVPRQTQVQRQSFMKVMQGSEMYVERLRRGTAV